ncbi:MAG: ribonuclease III [Clostridiales bacterium]|nr:ribonuclease III [Clostridiales bacterium]
MTNYFDIKLSDENIGKISNLGLAHLGDAVYELMVRVWLCEHGKCTSGGLHRAAVSYVNAPRQARMAEKLMPLLTEEEQAVYKRGRNTKVNSIPKNANPGEYHAATGLEALLGYLYLHGRQERINELFKIMMED